MPNFSGIWSATQQFQVRAQNIWPRSPGAPTIGTATAGRLLGDVAAALRTPAVLYVLSGPAQRVNSLQRTSDLNF